MSWGSLHDKPATLHGHANSKADMLIERYRTVHQRTARHRLFAAPAISSDMSQSCTYSLRAIEHLLGSSSKEENVIVLGILTQLKEGQFFLEDPTGVVRVNLKQAVYKGGLFTENNIVLAEGFYEDKIFISQLLVFPPPEPADKTPPLLQVMQKLHILFAGYSLMPPTCFVFIGNFLSLPIIGSQSKTFEDCFSQLGTMISEFPTLMENSQFIFVPGPNDPGLPHILPRMLSKVLEPAFFNFQLIKFLTELKVYKGDDSSENNIVLAEGFYEDKIFYITAIGFPPPEPADITLSHFPNLCVTPYSSMNSHRLSANLKHAEEANTDAMFVFLSDVWLDQLQVMQKLHILFAGYSLMTPTCLFLLGTFYHFPLWFTKLFSQLGTMISEFPTLMENSQFIFVPGPNDPGPSHIYLVIANGHLLPLPLNVAPVYWEYDHALSLYPLPDVVVCADKYDPYTVTSSNSIFFNPGSLPRSNFSFKVYFPSAKQVEDSEITDEQ
ncbi:DNA polymerase epsilon subunit 2 like protein [Argiope bruennichi]|uniref:DNA polymerase epsilon subunit n=1 Tax=Argiope bruennichi TaxID=94029 RepID=A0A8T0EYA4_ARGBR|nr:DNA polymerase epsilon subunit 2 like protein [Argiope bruennichi]